MQKTVSMQNRYRLHRLWLSSASVLLGIVAGFAVGRASILKSVQSSLTDYAERVLRRDEELSAETQQVLAKAQASEFAPCSDEDITVLRRLTFSARFLKDVGRFRDNQFVCSATIGKLEKPTPVEKPEILLRSGLAIYPNYPLMIPAGARSEIVAAGNSDVVLSTDVFSDFPQQPFHFAVGIPDWFNASQSAPAGSKALPSQTFSLSGVAGRTTLPAAALKAGEAVRVADTLYRARCSSRYPACAVASIAMAEVWNIHRLLLIGYTLTGGAAGISCALAILLVGNNRRSHSNQLRRAILMGQLSVVYQPIVDLTTHKIVGAEALARWTDEDGESIRPETIIALAEAENFVSEITRFVLTRALEEIRPILEGRPNFRLSINLAPSDLADPRLLLLLDERLASGPVTAANVAFELPERATTVRDVAVAAILRLRERGHAIFIDDFGTGYSNLAYLTELNVDGIKINRSFIATLGTESVTASIVPQILAVARALSLSVVVQGIEREEQAKYFANDTAMILGQGWFFGLPVPAQGLAYLCAERSE
jgi:sensor c-di-GMP phosphodiesterase-like protein